MSIILPQQQAIPLRNPYSVLLEQESDYPSTNNHTEYSNINKETLSEDDGLDQISVHSWSVIASTIGSDNEEEDEDDENEVVLDDKNIEAALTVSSLADGFTGISKTLTAATINSAILAGRSNTWAVKVSKKQRSPRPEGSPTRKAVHEEDEDESAVDMSLEEHYMQMTEHELSKSSKAVKLKNIRLATAADKELSRVLNLPDRKALPVRATVTERSKTRGRAMDSD